MRRLKFEIMGLITLCMVLFLTNDIEIRNIKYIVWIVIIIGIAALSYCITNEILKSLETADANRSKGIENISKELAESIAKYNDIQSSSTEKMISAIANFNHVTGLYMEKVESMLDLQRQMEKNEESLGAEIERMGEEIHNAYESQKILFEDSLEKLQINQQKNATMFEGIIQDAFEKLTADVNRTCNRVENTMEAFCEDFESEQKRANDEAIRHLSKMNDEAIGHLSKMKDAVEALKESVSVNLTNLAATAKELTQKTVEKLVNINDIIEDQLSNFNTKQKQRDEEQNKAINAEIEKIGTTISEQIQNVLEDNKHLLEYIEKVQEDWTTLNRDEIAFLDKVWKEK